MATFTVHVPPSVAHAGRRAERTIFVRDGFSLWAFLFGPVFLLYRRLWLGTLAWLVVAALLGVLAHALRLGAPETSALFLLLALLTGFEASALRQHALERRGYRSAGLLSRRSRDEAEAAFFAGSVPNQTVPRQPASRPEPMAARPRSQNGGDDVIGLFPQSGDGV